MHKGHNKLVQRLHAGDQNSTGHTPREHQA